MQRKTISANDINKYAYCPYQWYYERLYGRKELRKKYQERNERLSLEDHLSSHFLQGEEYHNYSFARWKTRYALRKIGIVLLFFVVICLYFFLRFGIGA